MNDATDPRLNRWTAEFADKAMEAAFREANHDTTLSLARLAAVVIVVATLPFVYATYLRFGDGHAFHILLTTRLSVAALAIGLLIAAWRRIGVRPLDRIVVAVIAAVQAQTILLASFSAPAVNLIDVQVILVLVCAYVFMPTRFVTKLVLCLATTFAFLGLLAFQFEMQPGERAGLLAWLVGANLIGVYACRHWDRMRRREFAIQERLRLANAKLGAAVSEMVTARADAERESRTKSQFLANISHELRTPLNAIIGFAEVMKGGLYGPLGHPRYEEYLQDIHKSGNYLLTLINDLLDLSKVEAGKFELSESECVLEDIAADAVRMVEQDARRRGVTIAVRLAPDLPPLWADARASRQILLNLLSNAVKFSPAGAEVEIAARIEAGGGLLLAVADSGPGIAPEDLAKVLQPFGQAATTTIGANRGTGLGLPLAASLARAHGGRLDLRSTPGRGTTAELRLPAFRLVATPEQHERS